MLSGLTFIDLFAGMGGFHLALESLGAECVWASEWNRHAADTYEANFGMRPAGDITQVDTEDIPAHDILCAGFPCQPFSTRGARRGFEDTRGTLFFDVARIIAAHRPRVAFLENVYGLLNHDKGKTFEVIIHTLADIGYTVHYRDMAACEYGAATNRRRVYIVAFRDAEDAALFSWPTKSKPLSRVKDLLETAPESAFTKREDITFTKGDLDLPVDWPYRLGHVRSGGTGCRIFSTNGTCPTLLANSPSDWFLIDGKLRRLTVREEARVMGYPETYRLHPAVSHAHYQLGNSVVVPVIRQVAERFAKALTASQPQAIKAA